MTDQQEPRAILFPNELFTNIKSFLLPFDKKTWEIYSKTQTMINDFFPRHWKHLRRALHCTGALEFFQVLETYMLRESYNFYTKTACLYAYKPIDSSITRLVINDLTSDFTKEARKNNSGWYCVHRIL